MQQNIRLLRAGAIVLLLVCGAFVPLGAQTVADSIRYTGNYRVGELTGRATFFYRPEGSDTLPHGPWQMQGVNLEALFDEGDSHFDFSGHFRDGEPTGEWRYVFGDYTASGSATVTDLQYHLNVNGVRHLARGTVAAGQPTGTWVQEVRRIENSLPTDLRFRSEVTFVDGVPQQSFRAEDGEAVLLGRCKRNGLAHDVWTVYVDLVETENWYFRDGLLQRIEVLEPEDTITLAMLEELPRQTKLVNADARYFRFLAAWRQLAEGEMPASRVTDLLTANAAAYAKVSTVMNDLGAADFNPVVGVRVPHFPLTEVQSAQLAELTDRLRYADTLSANLLDNTSLNIIANTDGEVAYLLAVLQHFRDEFLDPVASLTDAHRDEILAFLPRRLYYEYLWPEGVAAGTFPVRYGGPTKMQERTFSGPGAREFAVRRDGLDAVVALMDYAVSSTDSIQGALNAKLNTRERQRVLTALEDQFMHEHRLLDSLVGAQRGKLVKEYGLKNITGAAARELEAYARLGSVAAKQRRAPELTACLQDMEALAIELIQLPAQWEEIRELYTDEVWNNFTATVMEEELKKRLTEAYRDKLLPYFREQVTTSLDCTNAGTLAARIAATNQRMLALREQNTDELEDRLRQTDDPQAILALLNADVQ